MLVSVFFVRGMDAAFSMYSECEEEEAKAPNRVVVFLLLSLLFLALLRGAKIALEQPPVRFI
jgi:Flp pilus assembly protein protease CpaA